MAEYAWVMKQWQRMCSSMQGGIAKCDNCPLLKVICKYKPDEKVDFDEAEKTIADWAAKNPELVYPTWGEWLEKQGVVKRVLSPRYEEDGTCCYIAMYEIKKPLPADIAQKLGIEPKEVG